MSGIGKIFVVLNLVFSIAIVAAAAVYLSKADEWKTKHDDLKKEYTDAKNQWDTEMSDLNAQYTNAKTENTKKQNTIDDLELRITEQEDQLKSEKVNSQQLRDDVSRISSSLDSLKTTINDLRAQNETLTGQNAETGTPSWMPNRRKTKPRRISSGFRES